MKNTSTPSFRDTTIDLVRGLAIFAMVGANMAPFLPDPHSPFLRYYSSFSAPIFVTLAGTMVALAAQRKAKGQGLSYFIQRGLFIVGMGALVDVVAWGIAPFVGFDVLYLIGAILPICFVAASLSRQRLLKYVLLVFALTPLLQMQLGYGREVEMPLITDFSAIAALDSGTLLRHFFIDGWFPLFPWLGYGLLGVLIGLMRWPSPGAIRRFSRPWPVALALALVFLGLIGMDFSAGPQYVRAGYSELFYPATLGFIALSAGVVVLLIALFDFVPHRLFLPLTVLGEASLFMYIFHLLVLGRVYEKLLPKMTDAQYLALYGVLLLSMFGVGYGLRKIKRMYRQMPMVLKWVLGG